MAHLGKASYTEAYGAHASYKKATETKFIIDTRKWIAAKMAEGDDRVRMARWSILSGAALFVSGAVWALFSRPSPPAQDKWTVRWQQAPRIASSVLDGKEGER